MSNRAAIAASLVDVKNVGTHKSLRLTLHVPVEHAQKVIDAFGWPTMVDPVPVALARLNPAVERAPPKEREKRHWGNLSPSQQAGILCADKGFQRFLYERDLILLVDEEIATEYVRTYCGVQSRSDIRTGSQAHNRWLLLVSDYRGWEAEASVVPT